MKIQACRFKTKDGITGKGVAFVGEFDDIDHVIVVTDGWGSSMMIDELEALSLLVGEDSKIDFSKSHTIKCGFGIPVR